MTVVTRYDVTMEQNTHAKRMALVLSLMVVALVVISIGQFTGGDGEQQAAVLRAYAE